jgi:N-acetylmuramoyl-L-alanine amidase
MGLHKTADNMDVAQRENSVISYEQDYESKYENFNPNVPESYIIFSLMQSSYFSQSLVLATMAQEHLKLSPIKKSRGVQQAGFLVLWHTAMPSILVEIGFLSNPTEETLLAKEETRNDIAERIANAFTNYKTYYEQQDQSTVSTIAAGKETPPAAATSVTAAAATAAPAADVSPTVREITVSSSDNRQTAASGQTGSNKPATTGKKPATATNKPAAAKEPAAYYAIQIFATSTQKNIQSKEYESLKDMRCFPDGKFFKYVVEKHRTYDEALLSCLKLRAKYSDAFVVRIRGDKILPLNR